MADEHPAAFRREQQVAIAVAVLLIVFRSAVLVFWPTAQFDSDQAVIGLMGKHLSEGRAFPVFMYGQSYILGVQAWMAAPMFLLFGVSVGALKLPLLLINIAVAVLFIRLTGREIGLRPRLALVAALPFLLPAPGTAAHLVEASGGNLEPFLYVILMWMTRRRPVLCGVVFGIGFMQREFTIYGFVALIALWAFDDRPLTSKGRLRALAIPATAAIVWLLVQVLRQFSSGAGPGTNITDLYGQPNNLMELAQRTCIAPRTLLVGGGRLVTEHWPQLFGTARYQLADFAIESAVPQGLAWSSLLPALVVAIAVVRIASQSREVNAPLVRSIVGYLTVVGVLSAGGYVAGRCGAVNFYTMRYELLSLIGIVALGAWYLRVETIRALSGVWIALVLAWTLVTIVPHARFWHEYLTNRPIGAKEMVLRKLESAGVHYGTADYWMAYHLTFLAKERIVLASYDFVRIRTYNTLVAQHAAEAIRLSRQPCPGGHELVRNVWECRP